MLAGILRPVATGMLSGSEAATSLLGDAALRGPPALQKGILDLLVGLVAAGEVVEAVYGGPAEALAAQGRVALAGLAVAVFASVSPKADSCLPAEAASAATEALLAIVAERERRRGVGGGKARPPKTASKAAEALGHLGRSRRQRPSIVRRAAALMWGGGSGGPADAEPDTGGPGGSGESSSSSLFELDGLGVSPAHLLHDCATILFTISGHPASRQDMAPSLGPLIGLLQPRAAAANRATAGLAAATLFRLCAHTPYQVGPRSI